MIARWNLNLVESNTFSPQTAIDYANHEFKGFQYLSFFLNLINWEDVCISEVIDWLNLFLRDYWFYNQESSWKLIDYNINKLKKLVKVPWYKTIVSIPENISNLEEVVWVSCLWFSSLNTLSQDIKLNSEQLEKNLVVWLTIAKVKKFLFDMYWLEVSSGLRIWDYWLKLLWNSKDNAALIAKWQSYLEKELKNYLIDDWKISKLSSDFLNDWERKFSTLTEFDNISQESFSILLQNCKYKLSQDFIDSYITRYFNKDGNPLLNKKQLGIIYSSIQEHLELWYRISQKWNNKVFIFVWNQEKILLMIEVLKTNKSNNIMIWLSQEKK